MKKIFVKTNLGVCFLKTASAKHFLKTVESRSRRYCQKLIHIGEVSHSKYKRDCYIDYALKVP